MLFEAYTIRTRTRADLVCEGPRVTTIARGTRVTFDGVWWTIVNLGDTHVTLLPVADALADPTGRVGALDLPNDVFMAYLERGAIMGWEIPAASTASVTCDPASDPALDRRRTACAQDLALATARWHLIAPYVTGATPVPADGSVRTRTIYKWMARFRGALRQHGD